jgi:hypothetical protein
MNNVHDEYFHSIAGYLHLGLDLFISHDLRNKHRLRNHDLPNFASFETLLQLGNFWVFRRQVRKLQAPLTGYGMVGGTNQRA